DEGDHAHHAAEHGSFEQPAEPPAPPHVAAASDACTRYTSTLSFRPFTCRSPTDSAGTAGAAATVAAVAKTSPASASDCSRCAMFTASRPTAYSRRPPPPTVPAMTHPVLTPIPI